MLALFLVICSTNQPNNTTAWWFCGHGNNLRFLILSYLKLWVSRNIWSDVFWCGCHMAAVCGRVQTAEDTVSFTAQVCCTVTLEKKARTCLKLAGRHANPTQTHKSPSCFIYGSGRLYIAVSILSWLSAHSGSAGIYTRADTGWKFLFDFKLGLATWGLCLCLWI